MICKEFLNLFDKSEAFELSSQMLEHLSACSKCKQIVDVQKNAENSLSILRKTTPRVDLTARIMGKVLAEPGPLQQASGGGIPGSSSNLYSFAHYAIVAALCASLAVGLFYVTSGTKNAPANVEISQQNGWEMTMIAEKAEATPNVFSPIPAGEIVRMNDNQKAVLKFGDRMKLEMVGGSFVPNQSGLVVFSGTAMIKTKELAGPVSFGTPFGEIVPESGSQFIIQVRDGGLHIVVQSGSVKASYISHAVELKAGQEITLGENGLPGHTASASVQSNTAIDSLLEQGNPGN